MTLLCINNQKRQRNGGRDIIKSLPPFSNSPIVALLLLLAGSSPAGSDSPGREVPPFVAEAIVTQQLFRADTQQPFGERKARLHFSYTGSGWWDFELEYLSPPEFLGNTVRVTRIESGTRFLVTKGEQKQGENAPIPSATAYPMPYPNPSVRLLLFSWLAFTPHPELPLIDSTHIRRFSPVPVLEHPDNVGTYVLEYLQPGGAFLSSLEITDNGLVFGFDGHDPLRGRPIPRPSPFDQGFLECVYEVTRSTIYNGVSFPQEARFATYGTRSQDSLHTSYINLEITMSVTAIRPNRDAPSPLPSRLFGIDHRPANLPRGIAIHHIVTNDQWRPPDDPQLATLAPIAMLNAGPEASSRSVSFWLLALLATLLIFPSVILFNRFQKGKRKED